MPAHRDGAKAYCLARVRVFVAGNRALRPLRAEERDSAEVRQRRGWVGVGPARARAR